MSVLVLAIVAAFLFFRAHRLSKKETAISIKIIDEEFSRYKNDLAKIHRESADMLQSTSKDIAKQSIDMRNNLTSKQNIVELRLNEQQARLEK